MRAIASGRLLAFLAIFMISVPCLWVLSAVMHEFWNSWTYQYRLTIDIDVAGVRHTGASIVQVSVTSKSEIIPQTSGVSVNVLGDAVAVDLGERGALFALLRDVERPIRPIAMWRSSPDEIVQSAFPRATDDKSDEGLPLLFKRYALGGEIRELGPEQLPLLVRFRDINDPRTAEQVDPRNLAAAFGLGVNLTRVTIETIPISMFRSLEQLVPHRLLEISETRRSMRKMLPWLSCVPDQRLIDATGRTGMPYLNSITHGDFMRGKCHGN